MIGQTFGHYNVLEKLGEGGMGVVYKARDLRLDRFVALKVLPVDKMADEERRRRFIREARAASALNHPNIVTIHDIAEQDGETFIVMELVEGKPLNELIPRKGMRTTEALRIAAQAADALTAAHAAGIIHRDLKPANIMVDVNGRVKVLDFGLAKSAARAAPAAGMEDATRTLTAAQPQTEEGVILGSVPYMSPEQAEGRALDARTDIFSFGAVLYEMVTGQRAFRGESRASTLAAVVEKEPPPPTEIAANTPPELERLIARCLRKDVSRRSQNMADVKLALEELRDESESGKLVRSGAGTAVTGGRRRWVWPAVAVASVMVAAAVMALTYLSHRGGAAFQGPELTRLSPDDGYSYYSPSISADGKFVAYVSDRGGSRQVWLQQVAGGEPIQLTHSPDPVLGVSFFPDGAQLAYAANSADGTKGSVAVIPTLGGEPRVVLSTGQVMYGAIAPDGRRGVFFDYDRSSAAARIRLTLASLEAGELRELTSWRGTQPAQAAGRPFAWTSDGRYLLCVGSKQADAVNYDDWEWFALPVDGGSPRPTGAGDALRAAGLKVAFPMATRGDRVLFTGSRTERMSIWEIRLTPGTLRVRGSPRQLTFGTENHTALSVSASGMLAATVARPSADLYLVPLSSETGQPSGPTRRLTQDGRYKTWVAFGGRPGDAYFSVQEPARASRPGYALDLESGKQALVIPDLSFGRIAISRDGRQVAYSVPEGNSYSVRIAEVASPPGVARPLCAACGVAARFSRDGRFLFLFPEVPVRPDPKRKHTIRLLDVASGKDRRWLEHPTDSLDGISTFGRDMDWLVLVVTSQAERRIYLAPWREDPVPPSEWIEVKLPVTFAAVNWTQYGNFFFFLQGDKLMEVRFDPKTRALSDPYEVKYAPGSDFRLKPGDSWGLRGPGLVFSHEETNSSIWLLKLSG